MTKLELLRELITYAVLLQVLRGNTLDWMLIIHNMNVNWIQMNSVFDTCPDDAPTMAHAYMDYLAGGRKPDWVAHLGDLA